ncbi:serine-rich adhesin for platelets-like [Panonychus citri]|uniref:serine-rich adhesin for platelets-like n=1 Tax=Panonychus citri TaxID=50023 RepID=UPI002307F4E2|nr:serine-rich adhesin for platelets-like [Panonychus citri]
MATAKGLLNMPGQNNCFLNSAVQVLWHLDIFRRSFRELSGHACMGSESCIFCALKELFTQFQYSQESALPPDSLRKALAETFSDQRRFQLGFMDDAAECFENILLRIHDHIAHDEPEDSCKAPHCISHEKFAMNLIEQLSCSSCGYTSEPHPFTQLVNYVSSPALCVQAKKLASCPPPINPRAASFGSLLRSGEAYGNVRDCPSGCGSKIQIRRTLVNQPDIVSIGLAWDSERPSLNQITQIFSIIETQLNLEDVFDGFGPINKSRSSVSSTGLNGGCLQQVASSPATISSSSSVLELVGLVTYYGKHYSTFFYHTSLSCWIYFDDAAVREIGPHWDQVVDKCIKGHFQPLLLLYANPTGTAINASTAPQSIIRVSNHPNGSSDRKSLINRVNGFHSHLLHPHHLRSGQISAQQRLINMIPSLSSTYSNNNTNPSTTYLASATVSNGSNSTNNMPPPPSRPNRPLSLLSLPNHYPQQQQQSLRSSGSSSSLNSYQHQRALGGSNIYGTMRLPPKRTVNTNQHQITARPGSMDDLLNQYGSASDDVPDSPLTRSSVSSTYFSDAGDTDSGYISRKTVENILSMQHKQSAQNQQQPVIDQLYTSCKGQQRNSVSSIDSYSTELNLPKRSYEDKFMLTAKACSLQRRDSGNSSNGSGDRMSASSISSITSREENPYLLNHYGRSSFSSKISSSSSSNGRFLQPVPPSQSSSSSTSSTSSSSGDHSRFSKKSTTSTIDQGYDSFSLSSSDSYPSMGQTTPTKQSAGYFSGNSRLTQIPEDVQLMGLMANGGSALQDCDQLCSQSDVLMMKSVEKEREGDLITAAALSDSAAHKARFAMAAPYSNPQMLVSAKMKHSICVMRSANLHKRIKEKEAEEKRRVKMESIGGETSGHSRQGSRDSLHSRHSRQNSRDGSIKEIKRENKENTRKSLLLNSTSNCNNNQSNTITIPNKNNQSNLINGANSYNDGAIYANSSVIASNNVSTGNFPGNRKTIQLYATLPKKSCKKKLTLTNNPIAIDSEQQQSSNQQLSSTNVPPNLPEKPMTNTNNYLSLMKRSEHKPPPSDIKSDAECGSGLTSIGSIMRITRPRVKTNTNKTLSVYSIKDSDLSDNYYSEWEAVKSTNGNKEPLKRSLSGSTSTTTTTTQSTPTKSPTVSSSLFSSSASIKSVDTDIYSETSIGDLTSESSNNKKHKIRRKLLIGSFMKRKNRSLPDLRENPKSDSSDRPSEIDSTKNSTLNTGDDSCTINNNQPPPPMVAKISKKGFHQGMGIYQRPSLLKVKPPLLETSKLEVANNQIKSPIGNQQKVSTGGNQLTSNINQIQKHLIPRPPTPPRPKCSEEMSSMGLTTIKPSNNTNCPITKPSPLRPVLIKTVPIPSSTSPLPPPPPVDEVDCCLIKPGSPSTGIEPNDELPPPPESFLQELREKRNEMSSESLLGRLTSERLATSPSSRDSIVSYSCETLSPIRVPTTRSDYGDCIDSASIKSCPLSLTNNTNNTNAQSDTNLKSSSLSSSASQSSCSPSVKDLASRFQQLSTTIKPTSSTLSTSSSLSSVKPQSILNNSILNNNNPDYNNSSHQRSASSSILSTSSSKFYKVVNINGDKSSCSLTQSQANQSTISPSTVNPSPTTVNSINNGNVNCASNNNSTSPSSLRQGLRVVTLLGSTIRNNLEAPSTSQSTINLGNNKDNLIVNGQIKCSSPTPTINSTTDINGPGRPNRPPDYQTAIKRLSLMKDLKRLTSSPSPSTVNCNNSTVDHQISPSPVTTLSQSSSKNNPPLIRPTPISLVPMTSVCPNGRKSLLTSLDNQQKSISAPSPCPSINNSIENQSNNQQQQVISPIKVDEIANRRKDNNSSTPKKSVSFSDQVVLVAPAEDDDEDYLPNPLLQRVLGGNGGGKAMAQPSPA